MPWWSPWAGVGGNALSAATKQKSPPMCGIILRPSMLQVRDITVKYAGHTLKRRTLAMFTWAENIETPNKCVYCYKDWRRWWQHLVEEGGSVFSVGSSQNPQMSNTTSRPNIWLPLKDTHANTVMNYLKLGSLSMFIWQENTERSLFLPIFHEIQFLILWHS